MIKLPLSWRNLALAIVLAGLLLPAAVNAATPVPANQASTLTATSMVVTVFQYHGIQTITTAAGPVQVLEFGMATANFSGFGLLMPCESHPGIGAVQNRLAAGTASASSGVTTIEVTSLTATLSDPAPPGPAAVTWTVASPPAAVSVLVSDAGTLSGVTAVLAEASLVGVTLTNLRLQASVC